MTAVRDPSGDASTSPFLQRRGFFCNTIVFMIGFQTVQKC